MSNKWGIPDLGFGLGLRTVHYPYILAHFPRVDWFEILSENYLDTGGRPLYILDQIAERYPIVMHGVSMSVGSTDPLDFDYLKKLKMLAKRVNARWISDHLCWTGVLGRNTHDLLPMPYTDESLQHVASRVHLIADYLERPVFLENPTTYLEFAESSWTEWDFLAALCDRSGCGLLLDVNNVFVSAFNHGYDAREYIRQLPADRVVQIHLAGHTNHGSHILDTHSDHVIEDVWELYRMVFQRMGGISTLLEWDENIPSFEVVHQEALKAHQYRCSSPGNRRHGSSTHAA